MDIFPFDNPMKTKQRDARPACERCGKPLEPGRIHWLELSSTDGKYYEVIPEGHISQGLFAFGSDCAKLETQITK
jgi:hypothetical protein